MELTLEVLAAVTIIVAVGAERLTELFGAGLFASLRRYGINATSKDVRTIVKVALVMGFNFAVLYGLDVDVLAKLLEENSSYVTIALAAFTASGLSGLSNSLIKYFGTGKSVVDVLQTGLDIAKGETNES